jgi:hypothetical protein
VRVVTVRILAGAVRREIHPKFLREKLSPFRPARDSETPRLACLPRPAFLDVCRGAMG